MNLKLGFSDLNKDADKVSKKLYNMYIDYLITEERRVQIYTSCDSHFQLDIWYYSDRAVR